MPHFSSLVSQRRGSKTGPSNSSTSESHLQIGSWELLRRMHQGRYADVHLARPLGTVHNCADFVVKILQSEVDDDPTARQLIAKEAAAGRAVQHAHLVPVLEAHLRRDPCYLVMPRLEGVTLRMLFDELQCSLPRALRCVRQVAEALAELHRHGWRHGDVKPDNIMVSAAGHATLIDLSMASPFSEPLAAVHGTPRYAAPETHQGEASSSSDIYALGAMMFELIAGRAPLIGDSHEELARAHRNLTPRRLESVAEIPHGVGHLTRRMLQKSPHDRPFANQVIDELIPLEIDAFGCFL